MLAKAILVLGATLLEALTAGATRAQTPAQASGDGAPSAINLGGRGWAGSEANRAAPPKTRELEPVQFSARAGFATDYIYRGTTLSDRRPAVGAGIEATFAQLYAGTTVAKVRLPTQPNLEIAASGGIRPSIGPIDFDLGVTYFAYPGEALPGLTNGINYWEAGLRGDTKIAEAFRAAAGVAYSPNVSNTGARSWYVAAGLGYEVPPRLLPFDVGVSFTGGAGYSWFGTQRAELGGFPLPDYLNWQAGVTFTRKIFNVDLRYYDTNLSKENCFVFTGDPNARPSGRIDPVTNPDGLASNWCGATVVAKVSIAFN